MNSEKVQLQRIISLLENLIVPGGRSRLSPYLHDVILQVLLNEESKPYRNYNEIQVILHREHQKIEKIATRWLDFAGSGKIFSATTYEQVSFLDAYLAYYFPVNIAKLQLCFLDLLRQGALPTSLHLLDVGVGTGTTLCATIDFLIVLAIVCDLYKYPFPFREVSFTCLDSTKRNLEYAELTAYAHACALQARLEHQTPGEVPHPILKQAVKWIESTKWCHHDVNETPFDTSNFSCLVSSNCLNELDPNGRTHLNEMIQSLPESSIAIVIEPGDKHSTHTLMKWRQMVIESDISIVSRGPCGYQRIHALDSACTTCWAARREPFHQPPLYRYIRDLISKTDKAFPVIDEFENRLLSWSYCLLQKNIVLAKQQSMSKFLEKLTCDDISLTFVGSATNATKNVGLEVPSVNQNQEAIEYKNRFFRLCPAEVGQPSLYLERKAGQYLPPVRFGESIKFSDIRISTHKKDPNTKILSFNPKTSFSPTKQLSSLSDGFVDKYTSSTYLAVNEIGYRLFGFPSMKPFQHQVFERVLTGHSILAIAATGSGKSECFILPAMMLPGITIVISPLKSLMQDQFEQRIENRYGLQSLTTVINGDVQFRDRQIRLRRLELGHYKLAYFTPEQLQRGYVLDSLQRANENVGIRFLVFDEAHCISQWGHDFRSSYLNIRTRLQRRKIEPVLIALTATASPKVRDDLCDELNLDRRPLEQGGDPFIESSNRPELNFIVKVCRSTSEKVTDIQLKLQGIIDHNLRSETKSAAIVFMPHTGGNPNAKDKSTEEDSLLGSTTVVNFEKYLRKSLGNVLAIYHGKMEDDKTKEHNSASTNNADSERYRYSEQNAFMQGEKSVMVATKGFGMGIDKDNVRLVIHRTPPANLEAYAQEAGRAGRDGKSANVILYY